MAPNRPVPEGAAPGAVEPRLKLKGALAAAVWPKAVLPKRPVPVDGIERIWPFW